jgi:Bacteriophage lambda head decoration protein D
MLYSSSWESLPGIAAAVDTYEAGIRWGPDGMGVIGPGYIASTALDPTNSPTFELRVGLVMGQQTATGNWVNYLPTNTDGSEVAAGVLLSSVRMNDILTNLPQPRFYAILIGGPVQLSKLIGLDQYAQCCMADAFMFDQNYQGYHWFPYRRFQTKTASYAIQQSDWGTQFNNFGATGPVTFTLPPIQNGYYFGFSAQAAQNLLVTSNEGGNLIEFNSATGNTVAFQTGGAIIGGNFAVYTNPAGTKWIVENRSAGANTVTSS